VSFRDLKEHASSLLIGNDSENDEKIVDLMLSTDPVDISECLSKLAAGESIGQEAAYETWQVALLAQLLQELPNDPIYGLTRLTEFWADFGYPQDSPHVIQGTGSGGTPTQYYTAENYARILAAHQEWLKRKAHSLSNPK
jgi:hypothetical protein